jgi:poly(hydroxyalkanoate) depolymerase family esterase
MSSDFMEAMGRAVAATRARRPGEATRIIQAALTGQPMPAPDRGPQRTPRPRLDPNAEVAEPTRESRLRRPLREALRTLREGRNSLGWTLPGMAPHAPLDVPEGAVWETRRYACAAGARDFRLYVPAKGGKPRALVVMLHGCRQDPDDFARGTGMNALAERHGLLVAYPGQTNGENSLACWNWFRPEDQRRNAGEPSILAGMARELAEEFGIPPERVFVAGLSAGGAMAAVLGEAYPDVFAAVGIHSGLPAGAANDALSAFSAMRGEPALTGRRPRSGGAPMIVFHGTADTTVQSVNAERIVEGLAAAAEDRGEAGGRHYSRRVLRDGRGELWLVEGAGHAWSGGQPGGSYTDAKGPDASAEMVRFFLQ